MDKTFTVSFNLEVDEDDTRTEEEIEQAVRRALFSMPEVPYTEFGDITVTED